MKVELISYTPDALELLLFTKQTRLSLDAGLLQEIKDWPYEKKMENLNYMIGTIQSSWEFVSYVFSISGVSRALTHQLVRTRQASYAQQSQRTVNMGGFDYIEPEAFVNHVELSELFQISMEAINEDYQGLIQLGATPQDARAVLPTNVATNIIMAVNLRTLSDMAKLRLCSRTQGEYQTVFRAMRQAVTEAHPWADPFLRVACAATGVCFFPNYLECPIKPGIFNPDTGGIWPGKGAVDGQLPSTKDQIQSRWESMHFEAVPKESKK